MLSGTSIEEQIWNYFRGKGLNDYGIAGVMGNLYSESGLNPKNLQNTYNNILGMSDDKYTTAVDNGTYENFIRDSAGYGLAQWTYWSRKQGLLNLKNQRGCSIGDLELQLDYLYKELSESYSGVLYVLKNAMSILDSSNVFLLQFERPANQSEVMQKKRAALSQVYYDKFTTEKKGGAYIMSNSTLAVYTKISPNKSSPRNHIIDTITIHCVVGQCRIETLGELFANKERRGSSNYGVDKDGRIGLFVEEKDRSWCSSSSTNDNRAITIEVASDTLHPYAVTKKAYVALIDLCVDICKRNNIKELKWKSDKSLIGQIDKQNMTVHRWFANKECPGDYLYNRHGAIADEVNKRLNNENNNKMEDEDMDVKKFHELWLEMREELKDNDSANWSQEARDWSIENGLIQGGNDINNQPNYMWEDVMTREQFITVLYRFAQIMGRA